MKMTKADFEASTKAMVDLLEDPFFICREKEAQNAVTAIKQVMYYISQSIRFLAYFWASHLLFTEPGKGHAHFTFKSFPQLNISFPRHINILRERPIKLRERLIKSREGHTILRERLIKSTERLLKSKERHNILRERLIKSRERHILRERLI